MDTRKVKRDHGGEKGGALQRGRVEHRCCEKRKGDNGDGIELPAEGNIKTRHTYKYRQESLKDP